MTRPTRRSAFPRRLDWPIRLQSYEIGPGVGGAVDPLTAPGSRGGRSGPFLGLLDVICSKTEWNEYP